MEDGRPRCAEGLDRCLVQAAGARERAEDSERGPLGRQLEEAAGLLPRHGARASRDGPADHSILRSLPPGDRIGEENAAGEPGSDPVREAEHRVGLRHRSGDSPARGRDHDRPGHVAARAEDDVRPARRQDPAAGTRRPRIQPERPQQRGPGSPRQARDAKRVELEARLRNELSLDAIRRPGEAHRRPRFLPAETKLMSEKSAAGDFFPMN